MNGRNFLDLALLIPGVSPTNIGSTQLFAETSAVPGQGISIAQPAQPLQQLHRRRTVGQRRCRGAERNPVRRRCRRAVSGRDVRRAGGARPRARRLHQRRHEERHQRALTAPSYDFIRDDNFNAAECAFGHDAADEPAAVRRRAWRSARARSDVLFRELRAATARPVGLVTILPQNVAVINARLAAVGYPGPPVTTGIYPNPVHSTNVLGKVDHQRQRHRSVQRQVQPVSRHVGQLARCGRAERADARQLAWTMSISRLRSAIPGRSLRRPSTKRGRNSPTAISRRRQPIPSVRRSASPASHRSARSSGSPTARLNRMYQVVDNLSHQAGAHSLERASIRVQRRHHHLSAIGARQLRVFIAGELSRRQLQRLHADVR